MSDLEITLTWLGMQRYLERFIEAGFDSWDTILEITENDLNILNVDLGHRRKLQREIANSRRRAQDPAFNASILHPPNPPRGVPSGSTDVQQGGQHVRRGYRHHPKPDPNAPERPYSAYVLFSNHTREQLEDRNLSFTDLSKVVGESWQQLSRDEKDGWRQKGAVPWERYKIELAEYQKTDAFREYQRYLADFRAAQNAKNPQGNPGTTVQRPLSSTPRSHSFSTKHGRMVVSPTRLPESEQKHSKVAIKRIKRDEESWDEGPGSGTPSSRVRQACESCRNRKIKCYGEQPTCRHCRELGVECHYASRRPDQGRRQDDEIWQKLKAYEELLLKLVPQVDDDDQQAIQDAILMPPYDEAAQRVYKETIQSESKSASYEGGRGSPASAVGSMGPTDQVDKDDFHRQRTMAFAGQASETKWTEKLDRELLPKQGAETFKSQHRNPGLSQMPQPYAEDMDSAVVGHLIDPLSLPVKSTADCLVNAYFSTVHTSFPILNRSDFMNQYEQLYSTMEHEGFERRTFIAKLQLVFAIAAVHAHLIQAPWAGDARDHMLFFSQARVLAIDSGIFNDDCHLAQVQVFGLGGIYLLVTNQLNRAWNISALAVRSAQALGLHLRDVSSSVSAETKEFNAYNWFALMTLESMLTLITGRPTMIYARDCSVAIPIHAEGSFPSAAIPPPEPSHQESTFETKHYASSPDMSESEGEVSPDRTMRHYTTRAAATYFVHYAEICLLAKEVVSELYQPGIRTRQRPEIQSTIDQFDKRLCEWKDGVNPPFDVASPSLDPETESCRVALRILFYSTRTVINRPCLCRIDDRTRDHPSSATWKSINSAGKCVESARAVLNLILHKPDSITLREGTMWWMLLHHHKRALTVLLLELAFRAEHTPSEAGEIIAEAKAAVSWLHHLGDSSPDARRTYLHISKLLRLAVGKVGGDTSDMTTSSEEEATPAYRGQQQPPLAGYSSAGQNVLAPGGQHGERNRGEQWQYYADLTAYNGLDEFGFLRAEGGMGSLFPTSSEMDRMIEGRQREDYDMEDASQFE